MNKKNNIEKNSFDIDDGNIVLFKNFFNQIEANNYFDYLKNNIAWKQEKMKMYGKEVQFARKTAWYGKPRLAYSFSGITLDPLDWNKCDELVEIKHKIEDASEECFNSVLLNYYKDGDDYISWHSDDEKEFGKNPIISSVTFGCERVFRLRKKDKSEKLDIPLPHGSLLIMSGETQNHWQHMIPKKKLKTPEGLGLFSGPEFGIERINLTFRKII